MGIQNFFILVPGHLGVSIPGSWGSQGGIHSPVVGVRGVLRHRYKCSAWARLLSQGIVGRCGWIPAPSSRWLYTPRLKESSNFWQGLSFLGLIKELQNPWFNQEHQKVLTSMLRRCSGVRLFIGLAGGGRPLVGSNIVQHVGHCFSTLLKQPAHYSGGGEGTKELSCFVRCHKSYLTNC